MSIFIDVIAKLKQNLPWLTVFLGMIMFLVIVRMSDINIIKFLSSSLVFNKETESFTELYFTDNENLPKTDGSVDIKFSIQNFEGMDVNYFYEINLLATDSAKIAAKNQIRLPDRDFVGITERILLPKWDKKYMVEVKLIEQDQSIHYWVNNIYEEN